MKRISYSSLAFLAVLAVGLLLSGLALAADGRDCTAPVSVPAPTGAVLNLHTFNDCPGSTTTTVNNYPSLISIEDADEGCVGWANLHGWSFSEDGITPAVFENCSRFAYSATFKITGTGANAEGGLRVSPWWSSLVDGRLMVRAGGNGEISAWGGRLPFYSFSVAYGLAYVTGEPIWMRIIYNPHDLTQAHPATIQYAIYYQGQSYTSPELPFDQGNPAEDPPHGQWGDLYPTTVGGFFQLPNGNNGAAFDLTGSWSNVQYEGLLPTANRTTTWGQLKSVYR